MSSLVIGLDIGGSHITATLVRIEHSSSNRTLSIERDVFYTRSNPNTIDKDPYSIISTWIECIEDILHDIISNYKEGDSIIGIACGIPGPMDYERGVSYIQSTKLNKFENFFGLNLRLLLEYGLRDLISRWKRVYNPKYFTPPTSPRSSLFNRDTQTILEKSRQAKQLTQTVSTIPGTSLSFTDMSTTYKEIQQSDLSTKEITDYCGLQDNHDDNSIHEGDMNSHCESNLSDMDINLPKESLTTDNLTAKVCSMMKELSEIPISFYNDATCFAVGEANSNLNKNYKRILALTLGTGFGSTFIDQGEIIINRHDVPSGGMLWNCPYDETSIADDWFSTRGLINIYNKILRQEFLDEHSDLLINKSEASSNIDNKVKTIF